MSNLEIIQIRTAKTNQKLLNEFLSTWLAQINANEEIEEVKIYKRKDLETDYSVHIELSGVIKNDKNQLGERLASALKDFGIVNHSIWIEEKLK
ncbi:hypothetical protein MNBD_IGNAVI01-3067 [hydrothermal vent metagenome]|uniref:Uncharacterized protein n=1 Tax=hydrothermal vent metagenome TaxID=652676 RepID=A0A3B1BQ26_9ZZZZ